jgi:YaiO family outer membrane protein
MQKTAPYLFLLFFSLLLTADIKGQDTTSSDGLLAEARKAAFEKNDYAQAKTYLYKALAISPGYADIKIFLGRIYTWSKQLDSARYFFNDVLVKDPGYEDASVAFASLEYWNDNNNEALRILDSALRYHPASEELLLLRAKVLNAERRYPEAQVAVDRLLTVNRNSAEGRSLANRIRETAVKNKIGFSYDYVYFDKQFNDPWHLSGFDYTRTTGIGSVSARINYANRFAENGVQYELEAYPRISETFYVYANIGYSDKIGVFPHWRSGFSLYANLPKSWEAELGFRYLKFSDDPVWVYTAYLGKYYKSWLFGARTYLTPSTFSDAVSASYSVSARYYFGSADDYVGTVLGYGISPDDRSNSIQLDDNTRLVSYKVGTTFRKKLSRFSGISVDGNWVNQEYLPQTKGNQYQISLGWFLRF